tara:strand:+ start:11143 stop:11703 length:561 start_codon:yes stop_codon:yes gene_type:complete
MAYGSKKTSDGKEINADENRLLPNVGIQEDCIIKGSFELSEDLKYASMVFVQSNGAEVSHKEWDNDDEASQDDVNRRIKHICTKLVTEQEYDTLPETNSFTDYIKAVNTLIEGKTEGKFRMLFHFNNKGYVSVPRYPNFIEKMEVKPSKITISKYVADRLVRKPAPQADPELMNTGADTELPDFLK